MIVKMRMHVLRLACLWIAVLLLPQGQALAGPADGEMFGYRIGSKYPNPADAKIFFGHVWVNAKTPDFIDGFTSLKLNLTTKSNIIVGMWARAEFNDRDMATAFLRKLIDALTAEVGRSDTPENYSLNFGGTKFSKNFGNKYNVKAEVTTLDGNEAKILVKFAPMDGSSLQKQLMDKSKQEYKSLCPLCAELVYD